MDIRTVATLTITLLALLLGSLLAACGGSGVETTIPTPEQEKSAPVTLDRKSLVAERCTKCHDLARVERAEKREQDWKATVERMVEKGASLNQEEQELVIKYLTETYPK